MLALFLGAGFSRWAAGLPVASQLFDFDIQPWGPRERRKLEIAKSLRREWKAKHPGGLAEQFVAHALSLEAKSREVLLWYLVRRLSKPFIWQELIGGKARRHVLMIDENRRFDVAGVVKARSFLQRFFSPWLAGIITTNYDMIVEYALGTKGFNYGVPNQRLAGRGPYPVSQWKNPVRLRGKVPLAKIHGSVSWDSTACYTNGRRGLTGHALIVAPTPEKRPPVALGAVWALATRILQRATCLVAFGFAFNPYDEAVLDLLGCAGRSLRSVLLIDIEPETDRARRVWHDISIASCQPPPHGSSDLRGWLVSQKSYLTT